MFSSSIYDTMANGIWLPYPCFDTPYVYFKLNTFQALIENDDDKRLASLICYESAHVLEYAMHTEYTKIYNGLNERKLSHFLFADIVLKQLEHCFINKIRCNDNHLLGLLFFSSLFRHFESASFREKNCLFFFLAQSVNLHSK